MLPFLQRADGIDIEIIIYIEFLGVIQCQSSFQGWKRCNIDRTYFRMHNELQIP